MTAIKVAHVSDTHIGYTAYSKMSAAGENQRSVDMARAFMAACNGIRDWDPDLVVHSGDVADKTMIPVRYILWLRDRFKELAEIRPDGSRRQVVIIAGNHEQPAARKEACFLELLTDIEGVHVCTGGWETLEFHVDLDDRDEDGNLKEGRVPEALAAARVVCIPHDSLRELHKEQGFDAIGPEKDKTNVLVTHGVADGSELYRRSLGREYPVPATLLRKDWDYVALGHWHKQGPVDVRSDRDRRVWYAGSCENTSFADLLDNDIKRGWLAVTLEEDELNVEAQHVPTRPMYRLPVCDADGMHPEEITEKLIANLKKARKEKRIEGDIIGQIVDNVTRETWGLVDLEKVRNEAGSALHYELVTKTKKDDAGGEIIAGVSLGDIASVIDEEASNVKADIRDQVVALARDLISRHLKEELAGAEALEDGDEADETGTSARDMAAEETAVAATTEELSQTSTRDTEEASA